MTDRLLLLAGQSPDAQALLQAAAEGVISGPELEAHLLTHASPAVFTGGMAQALFAAMTLEDATGRWQAFDGDPASLPEWTAEEVDAEVLHALFVLTTGRQPCRRCLNGWLIDLDHLSPAGECAQHTTAVAA